MFASLLVIALWQATFGIPDLDPITILTKVYLIESFELNIFQGLKAKVPLMSFVKNREKLIERGKVKFRMIEPDDHVVSAKPMRSMSKLTLKKVSM